MFARIAPTLSTSATALGVTGLWLARKYSLPLVLEVNAPLAYEQKAVPRADLLLIGKVDRKGWSGCGADLVVVVSESLRRH